MAIVCAKKSELRFGLGMGCPVVPISEDVIIQTVRVQTNNMHFV